MWICHLKNYFRKDDQMAITHILKDGTKVADISGKVIEAKEHRLLYEVINRINEQGRRINETVSTSRKSTETI